MSKQLVYKILRNPIHYGLVEIPKFGISVEGKHEPIISKGQFDEVQVLMGRGKSHKQPRNRNNPEFPLKGVRCGLCGRNLTGGFVTGRSKKYPYYSCMNSSCSLSKTVPRKRLEDDFTEFLEQYTPDQILMEALAEALRIVSKKQNSESFRQTQKTERMIVGLETELEELLQLRISGTIDTPTFVDAKAKRELKLRDLRSLMVRSTEALPSADHSAELGLQLLSEFPRTWRMFEPGELKELRRVLFPQNLEYMYPGFKTAELSPIYKVKAASGADKNRLVTSSGFEPEFSP